MSASVAGLVTLGLYLALMVAIGIAAGRGQHSAEDLWVGGRRFGTWVMVLGMMAAVMHGGSILSGVAFAAAFGGVAILPFMSFTLGFLVILVFFARKLRESRAFTLPDYMGDRFASTPLRAFSAFVVAASSVVYLIAQIRGMGFILEGLLGTSFGWSMVLGTYHRWKSAFQSLMSGWTTCSGHYVLSVKPSDAEARTYLWQLLGGTGPA